MFKFSFALLLTVLSAHAWADIWGYIDERGVGHFASERLDARYELFSKGSIVQATPDGALQVETPAALIPPDVQGNIPTSPQPMALSPKLTKFFESSVTLKAVRPHMEAAAQKHHIEVELLQALIAAESGFNASAISPKGALGLMQLMPATAARYGVQGDRKISQQQKLFDPQTNIAAGSRYLRDLLNLFKGRLDLALAAYNAGEGAVLRAGNKIPNYPETQNYVRTVMQMHAALRPPPLPAVQASPVVAPQPKRPTSPDPLRPTKGRGNGLPLN